MVDFFTRKFNEISDYIIENQDRIDKNSSLKNVIREKLRRWLLLASFLADDNLSIEQFQNRSEHLGIDGILQIFSKLLKKEIRIVSEVGKYTKEHLDEIDRVTEISHAGILTIKDIKTMFDAEIIGIGDK